MAAVEYALPNDNAICIRDKEITFERWDTSNPPHLSKLITALLSAWSPTTYNHVTPKQWICDSIGFVVATPKANSGTTGAPDPTTEPTIGPNIIAPCITLRNAPQF